MAALTNTQISVTYVGLIKTSGSTVLSSTAQQLTDGGGTASPLYLSTSALGIGGSPTAGKELDVTGNVLITGDLQIDNINIDGNTISATSGVVTLQDGTIATTQSQGDNSTKVATTAYVDTAGGAFLPLAGGTMSGSIAMGSNNISGGGTFTATTFSGQLDGTISSTTTATTQSQNDNSTKVATTAYVDAAIGANDTLAEILANGNTTGGTDLIVSTSDQIFLPNGSETNPALTFTNDSDTGIFLSGVSLKMSTAGEERLSMAANFINFKPDGFTRFSVNYNGIVAYLDTEIQGELTVTGTGQSSFAGQVTIPETPSASTDAASKGYVDSQVGANNELSEVLANGNTTGGTDIDVSSGDDITFTDTSKAYFGTDNDLQIYHDGSTSDIWNYTGDLRIRNNSNDSNIDIAASNAAGTGSQIYIRANGSTGAAELYHYATQKLATTTNGVEVTGTLIDLDSSTNATVAIDRGGTSNNATISWQNAGSEFFRAGLENTDSNLWSLLHTCGTGLYFDGSNMRLGFGEDTPDQTLHIKSASTTYALAETTGTGTSAGFRMKGDASADYTLFTTQGTNQFAIYDNAAGAERLRIEANGGIYNNDTTGGGGNTWYGRADAGNPSTVTGEHNTSLGYAAGRLISSGSYNVSLGSFSLDVATTGLRNTSLGSYTNSSITTGSFNTSTGYGAGGSLTSGSNNVAVGYVAMNTASSCSQNTAIGAYAMANGALTVGDNTAVGYFAGASLANGYDNVLVGSRAGDALTSGHSNTALGVEALTNATTGVNNTVVGKGAGDAITGGSSNTALGQVALSAITTQTGNTAIGRASQQLGTGQYNTSVGNDSLENVTGSYNTAVGFAAGVSVTSGGENVAIGYYALAALTTGGYNTALGTGAGVAVTSGLNNTLLGRDAGASLTSGSQHVAIGYQASLYATTQSNTVAIGYRAGFAHTAAGDTYLGYQAGYTSGSGNGNVGVGLQALYSNSSGYDTTAVGYVAGENNSSGYNNAFFGFGAGRNNTSGDSNTYLGAYAGYNETTGVGNVFIGNNAGLSATTAAQTIAIGYNALRSNQTAGVNIAIGRDAMYSNTGGVYNTVVGYQAHYYNTANSHNTMMGLYAGHQAKGSGNTYLGSGAGFGQAASTGSNNVLVGYNTGYSLGSGSDNTYVGEGAGIDTSSGYQNTGFGRRSLENITTGAGNVGLGYYAGGNITTGGSNIAIGYSSMQGNAVTGTANLAVGDAAGYNLQSGGNNILIGKNAGRSTSTTDSLAQVDTQSNQIHIGNKTHTDAKVNISWTIVSDKRDKTNIQELDKGLAFVENLNPVSYERRKNREADETDGKERYGFLAQDILNIEGDKPVIVNNEDLENLTLTSDYIVPILVNAIKELKQEIETLKSQINN